VNPHDYLSNSRSSCTVVSGNGATNGAWIQLLGVDPLRVGLSIIPLFGESEILQAAVAQLYSPATLTQTTSGNGVYTTFKWNAVQFDTAGFTVSSAVDGAITIPVTGYYLFTAGMSSNEVGNDNILTLWLDNGDDDTLTGQSRGATFVSVYNSNIFGNKTVITHQNAGDKVHLHADVEFTSPGAAPVFDGLFSVTSLFVPASNLSPGFAIPVQSGSPPNIDPATLSQSVDPFTGVWIQWPQYAPLTTYGWWYWVPGPGAYSFLINQLFLVDDPCRKREIPKPQPPDEFQPPIVGTPGGQPGLPPDLSGGLTGYQPPSLQQLLDQIGYQPPEEQ
jgi:hypothetical protein